MSTVKDQQGILDKLNIKALNAMQVQAQRALQKNDNVVLLSPTGTGKTLAFLLPILEKLDPAIDEIQALILVPSRELAIQIEQVLREMGTGYKVNAVYGGRAGSKDKIDLKHRPALLIGTPGRVADRIRRKSFALDHIETLVLDEFDKSLEVGFEEEMKEIIYALPKIKRRVLTSATQGVDIPEFVGLIKPTYIDHLGIAESHLLVRRILSPEKDKLNTLVKAIAHIGNQPGIIFCNYKDTIDRVSEHLNDVGIPHGCFYGGMEQIDRERTLIKFRNGTHQLIIATDLAARGLDIPEIKFIIHYQLPHRSEEFTHRNGRTARMNADGTAYVLQWEQEPLPDFIPEAPVEKLSTSPLPSATLWETIFVSGGRKDKISKGDIAGTFLQQGALDKTELGLIEIKQDCAFVAVKKDKATAAINKLDNSRIKKKKVRVYKI
jgi:superfamily II DNA/RNA helicase